MIDLPASMLSPENILDVSFYRSTFSLIFDACEMLLLSSFQEMKSAAFSQTAKTFATSGGLTGMMILSESVFIHMKSSVHAKQKKHIGKYLSVNR